MKQHANPQLVEAALDKLVAEGREDDFDLLCDEVFSFPGDGPPHKIDSDDGEGYQYFSEKHGVTLVWFTKPDFGRLECERIGARIQRGFFREESGELAVLVKAWDPVTNERGHVFFTQAFDKRDIEGEAAWTDNEALVVGPDDPEGPAPYNAFCVTENEGVDPMENDCHIECYGDAFHAGRR